MTTLKIEGFLSIKSATIDIKPLTVLIGPQAQGKSIIAKLTFFFDSLIRRLLLEVVSGEITITALRKSLVERFTELFPRQAWSSDPFLITYQDEDWIITVARDGSRKNATVTLMFSNSIETEITNLIKELKPLLKESIAKRQAPYTVALKRREIRNFFNSKNHLHKKLSEQIFVPASRSFFANVEKNIFSLISSNFEIDPLMAEFGSTLERARIISRFELDNRLRSTSKSKRIEVLFDGWKHIIQGGYLYDGKDEFIVSKDRRVKLSNSSSGQQEVVPLLMALGFNSASFHGQSFGGNSYYIEEPEAHLFPYAQKSIAEILIQKLNEKTNATAEDTNQRNRVLVTTHSPYILTAINNLVFAGHAFKNPEIDKNKLEKIVAKELTIDPNDVSAYKVNGGAVTSIFSKKTQLIDTYLIDEISEEFAKDFDALIDLGRDPEPIQVSRG